MNRAVLALLALAWAAAPARAAPPAERIVVLAPHLAEIAWAAGAGERLVGAVEWSDYPPAVKQLPRVGDAFSIDDERIAALGPDLVLAWKGGTPEAVVARLRSRGWRVESLATVELEDVAAQVRAVGAWAGTQAVAEAAAARFLEGLAALRGKQAGKPVVRVFYQVSSRPLYTVGGDQVITRVLSLCRGENVFADLGQPAAVVDLEAVVARDPEAILAPEGVALGDWADWPGVTAVRLGNVFEIDGDLVARPSPRLLEGAAGVCARLDAARGALSPR